jgi:hypothetical protein
MTMFGALAFCVVGTGCATLFSDGSQQIKVSSNVPGATVFLDNEPIGQTPMRFELDRDTFKRHELSLEYQGKRTEVVKIKKSLNTTSLFNCTSILSWGTDALTGHMMEYHPDSYFIEVEGPGGPQSARERELMWFVVMNHKPLLREIARYDGPRLRAVARLSEVPREAYPAFAVALARRLPAMLHEEYPERLLHHVREVSNSGSWARRLAAAKRPTAFTLSALGLADESR